MSLRKGQAPQSYREGKLRGKGLESRTPEEMKEIVRKSHEARKRNAQRRIHLGECMQTILNLRISNQKQKQALKEMGISDEDLINETLLMVALFRKGLTGDVPAIKEVITMMDKLELLTKKEKQGGNVTINVIQQGEAFVPSIDIDKEIMEVENGQFTDVMQDSDSEDWDSVEDDWGNDVYTP